MHARVDHLVVLAADLAQGARWCEHVLGVVPGAGGSHPLMGTHNRLLRVATVNYPQAYLEIIAIDPDAPAPVRSRWFDLDEPVVRARLAEHGPVLAHFVAAVPDAHEAVSALQAQGLDRGEVLAASRMTPQGLLEWRISVRDDGQRLLAGTLPTLIEWGAVHPATHMPRSGLTLQSVQVTHPEAATLEAAYQAIGLRGVRVAPGPACLTATLRTPRGLITLSSEGL